MLEETPAQLVAHLNHESGWWRDTAQQLLVQRQNKSVVPALQNMLRTSENPLARIHALWTLEGLGALDLALVRELMKDSSARIRVQAIRASETLYKSGGIHRALADDYRAMAGDTDPDVAIQALLTAHLFKLPDVEMLIKETMATNTARGIQEIGQRVLQRIASAASTAAAGFSSDQQAQLKEGETIYKSVCATCHGEDGRGVAVSRTQGPQAMMGPALAGSPRVQGHRDYVIKTLLHGMTGPLAGQTFTQVMLPMGAQNDKWIADVASYIRNELGNSASFISPADVARVRAATANRKAMWTYPELEASLPRLLPSDPTWKATASHNAERAANGLTLAAWTTGVPQEPGMWFQVEMPTAATISEIQFESGPPGGREAGRGAGRGARAPGGPPAAAPGAGAPVQPTPPTSIGGSSQPSAPAAGRGRGGAPIFGSYPLAYQVQVSMDGKAWGKPVAEGTGTGTPTIITFKPVQAKFVRVTQTGKAEDAPPWSVLAFRIYASKGM
jgi:mono/diheme cytochrome c family protein